MDFDELSEQTLDTWRRHNDILLYLLDEVPAPGLDALPAGSRGRTVALQFAHLDRVRVQWLQYFETGMQPKAPRVNKEKPPGRVQLRKALRASGRDVERFLETAIRGDVRPRMFNKSAIRWMGYLIAHESHHRGQILLALKQSGMRIKEDVAMQGVWGKWIWGR